MSQIALSPEVKEKKDARDLTPGLRIYELTYKKGMMIRCHFQATDKKEAIEMGKKFCQDVHGTFCGVNDFLVDLVEYAKVTNDNPRNL